MSRSEPLEPIDATGYDECQLDPSPDYLTKADFIDPKTGGWRDLSGTIEKVWIVPLPVRGTSKVEPKPALQFVGMHKKFVIGAVCNRVKIKAQRGDKCEKWPGLKIVMYFDPTVKFGRDTPGGIRIR